MTVLRLTHMLLVFQHFTSCYHDKGHKGRSCGKGQKWFTRNTWKGANDERQEGYRDGYAITGILLNWAEAEFCCDDKVTRAAELQVV